VCAALEGAVARENRQPLTDEQRKSLTPALQQLEVAIDEVNKALAGMGKTIEDDFVEDRCFFCSCTSFVGSTSGGGPPHLLRRCGRASCGHSLIAHRS
jgi:hypothetical protein